MTVKFVGDYNLDMIKDITYDRKTITALKNIVGEKNIITDKEGIYAYTFDCSHTQQDYGKPVTVVFPETTKQVSSIIKFASQYNIPVIPRGAGTNHAGGCVPVCGGIILHFSKMNKIIDINPGDLTCRVQPGVVIGDLQKAAAKFGLYYPPDPSNLAVSTIGGGIALSSGGPRTFKYGTVKDYVIDLEIVMSDGAILHTGSNTAKNVTGLNLTQLIVGSEGTLAVVTEALLRLIPQPQCKNVLLVYFNSLENAVNTVTSLLNNHLVPAVIDLIDKKTINTIEDFMPAGLLCDKEAALLIEIDGDSASVDFQMKKVNDLCLECGAANIICARNIEEQEKIWTARRSAFAACAKLAPNVITEDVVVPRSKISQLAAGIEKLAEKYGIITLIMGHIGDGNIHPNFALDLRDSAARIRFEQLKKELFELAASLGGTLSGEHGIGCQKAGYLNLVLSGETYGLMKKIKNVFDPKNIMNPGKFL